MKSLLIDIGSTFIKYGVYDEAMREMPLLDSTPFPKPLIKNEKEFIVSIEEIKEKILEIFSLAKQFNCKKAFFSVQMHGYVLRGTDTGFEDYVSWRDTSGDVTDSRFKNINFNLMGTSLKNNLPFAKIAYSSKEGEFYTLGSYIVWMLTGKNATHITDACASGFFYADTGKCNEYAGNLVMPDVYKEVKSVGMYEGICIYTPIGDHQISFLGSGANTDKYLVNIGTATQISCVYGENYPDGEYEKRPYFNQKRLYTVSGLVGGDKIYHGEGTDELYSQVSEAIKKLPPKDEILLGGGGAKHIYEFLSAKFAEAGLSCSLVGNNIGMEGLKMVAEKNGLKAGTMLSEVCFPNFPIIAKNSNLDFIIIDNEHGYFDYSDIAKLIVNANLIGLEAIVRIGDNSRGHITKLADMGVRGFLLPMTNCREDIEEIVKYAKYSPIGKRGISTTRVHTLYNPPPLTEYMESANEKMKIYAQIETLNGVKNIDKILETEGVDGFFIGPNDLSIDLDCVSNKEVIVDIIPKLASAAKRADKIWGIITADKKFIETSLENNVGMISVGSELNMLINGCKSIKEMF